MGTLRNHLFPWLQTFVNEPIAAGKSDLSNSTFMGVGLDKSRFEDCGLAGATFDYVNLSDARFGRMNLSRAVFDDGLLPGTRFNNLNMSGALFENVLLIGAAIRSANLNGLHVSECNVAGMRIDGILVSDLLAAYRKQN